MLVPSAPVTPAPAMLPPDSDINKKILLLTLLICNNDDDTNTSTTLPNNNNNIVIITIFLDSGRAAVQISRGGAAVMRLPLAATMAAG